LVVTELIQPANSALIQAAGGIVTRRSGNEVEVMLVHRNRYGGDWTLPKGKLKEGETFEQAAAREVEEETGCKCTVREFLGAVAYPVDHVPKIVVFFRHVLVEQGSREDDHEVVASEWVPIADAYQRLTYAEERALLLKCEPKCRELTPIAAILDGHTNGTRPSLWGRRSRDRLRREVEAFRVELEFLEQRSNTSDLAWSKAAREQLENVRRFFHAEKEAEGGWHCLNLARRHAVFGLDEAELSLQAAILLEEADKLSSWRRDALKRILSQRGNDLGKKALPKLESDSEKKASDTLGDGSKKRIDISAGAVTAAQVALAMELRDEFGENQYHKIWLTVDQLKFIVIIGAVALALFLSLIAYRPFGPNLDDWGLQVTVAVALFGIMGAAFSAAQAMITGTDGSKIPERMTNHLVTLARTLAGAVAGLAGYAFYKSKILQISLGDNSMSTSLAIAFIFGYTGERLISKVAGTIGANK
jgi:8-oxo-dGTP diphosphatase